jgi:hypothetical protein
MRRLILLAGLGLVILPALPAPAEARPGWEKEHRRAERHWRHERRQAWRHHDWHRREAYRREAWRREAWHREAWRRRHAYHPGPPVAYAVPQPGVTLQLNLR